MFIVGIYVIACHFFFLSSSNAWCSLSLAQFIWAFFMLQARNVYLLSSIVESIQVSLVMNCQGWINSSCDTSFAASTKAFDYRAINLYINNQIIKTACIVHGQLIDSHMLININSPDFLLTTSHELDPDPEMLHSWSYHYRHLWKTY